MTYSHCMEVIKLCGSTTFERYENKSEPQYMSKMNRPIIEYIKSLMYFYVSM